MTLRPVPTEIPTEGGSLTAALGLTGADTDWATKSVTPELRQWMVARWSADTRSSHWETTDNLIASCRPGGKKYCGDSSLTVDLAGLPDPLTASILAHMAHDNHFQKKANPSLVRTLVGLLREGGCMDVTDLPEESLNVERGKLWRRWVERQDLLTADPDLEWQRGVIRTAVIRSDSKKNFNLPVRSVNQPWLRELLVDVLKARYPNAAPKTLQQWVRSCVRLSNFLTLGDGQGPERGQSLRDMSATTMDNHAALLRRDPDISDDLHQGTLWNLSSVLTQARALGFADRLPRSFSVQPQHYPVMMEVAWEDKAFPDALFALLLGGAATFTEDEEALAGITEEGFGQAVLDLATSIPGTDWTGRVFGNLLHTAANYGRRTTEVCSLPADTIREQPGTGHPGILYTNFKSKREAVLLPIDRHSRTALQAWIHELRRQYPNTALDALALFPAPTSNDDGTNPITGDGVRRWFKIYILLLEQAIILGHLHAATGVSLTDLLRLRVGDLSQDGDLASAGGSAHPLPAWHWQMLTDYRHNLQTRLEGNKLVSGYDTVEQWPLFPDADQQRCGAGTAVLATPAARFEPLGPDWLIKAATYRSAGLPGTHFGEGRYNPDRVTFGRFRHTYLQQLVNIGADIFLVQELADHKSVQTTVNSYVRPQQEKLHEAIQMMQKARTSAFGAPVDGLVRLGLPTRSLIGSGGADCENPQVHAIGIAGCDQDGNCFDCPTYAIFDPSHLPEINAKIATATRTLHRKDAEGDAAPGQLDYIAWKRDGWRGAKTRIHAHLDALTPGEREATLSAAKVVADFRSRVHNEAGITLGANT